MQLPSKGIDPTLKIELVRPCAVRRSARRSAKDGARRPFAARNARQFSKTPKILHFHVALFVRHCPWTSGPSKGATLPFLGTSLGLLPPSQTLVAHQLDVQHRGYPAVWGAPPPPGGRWVSLTRVSGRVVNTGEPGVSGSQAPTG